MSKRMSSRKRKDEWNPFEFNPKTMKARFTPPRAIHITERQFIAYLAAAQERREEDERKWQSLMDLYSNTCRNGGDKQ